MFEKGTKQLITAMVVIFRGRISLITKTTSRNQVPSTTCTFEFGLLNERRRLLSKQYRFKVMSSKSMMAIITKLLLLLLKEEGVKLGQFNHRLLLNKKKTQSKNIPDFGVFCEIEMELRDGDGVKLRDFCIIENELGYFDVSMAELKKIIFFYHPFFQLYTITK